MRTAPPGSLAKPQTSAHSTLLVSPLSRRLTAHLQDLITIAYERSTNRRSNSLNLIKLEYASAVQHEGKFCMRLNALVRELDLDDTVPLTVIFTVDTQEVDPCWEH